MANSGRGQDHDPDDWFDEPDTADAWSARIDRFARARQGRAAAAFDPDDWVRDGGVSVSAESTRFRPRRAIVAVAALSVCVLVVVLAAAGVFSGGAPKVAAPTRAQTSAPAPTTTAAATPSRQAPAVPTTPLKPGDSGAAVSALQRALERAGSSPGAIDGTYGNATTQAVTRFQQAHGLTADGVAGPKTLTALRQALQTG